LTPNNVGLASDLRWRLNAHLTDRLSQSWDRFSVYLTVGDKHLRELESLLLRVVKPKPKGNVQSGKFTSSENLLRRFKRDIKAYHRAELNALVGQETDLAMSKSTQEPDDQHVPLSGYVGKPFRLRARFKGRTLNAQVRRDGTIRFQGKIYRSPSVAGAVACKRISCNGWWFWKYERAPGDWVRLDELRK